MDKWFLIGVAIYLLYIAFIDIKTLKIYNKSLIPLLIAGVLYGFFSGEPLQSFKGFIFGGFFFMTIYILSKGKLGEGDIKLAAILGLFLGLYKTMGFILLACLLQICVSIFLKRDFNKVFPFAPALCLSAIISLFWGYDILFLFF